MNRAGGKEYSTIKTRRVKLKWEDEVRWGSEGRVEEGPEQGITNNIAFSKSHTESYYFEIPSVLLLV